MADREEAGIGVVRREKNRMRSSTRFLARFFAAGLSLLLAGTAWAQTFPQGVKSGTSPQQSQALVTLAIPAIVGVNVAHNFVLDFSSSTKCWGNTGYLGGFPPGTSGTTTYTFAVSTVSIPSSSPVACPGASGQPDIGTIQVLSTMATASRLQAAITDGGVGGGTTTFSSLIPDIFSAHRLTLNSADSCAGGSKAFPFNLATTGANEVTAIPITGWADCKQTLSLALASSTPVGSGTATGTLTFTMVSP